MQDNIALLNFANDAFRSMCRISTVAFNIVFKININLTFKVLTYTVCQTDNAFTSSIKLDIHVSYYVCTL